MRPIDDCKSTYLIILQIIQARSPEKIIILLCLRAEKDAT